MNTKKKNVFYNLGSWMIGLGRNLYSHWGILFIAAFVSMELFALGSANKYLAFVGLFILTGFAINKIRKRKKKS